MNLNLINQIMIIIEVIVFLGIIIWWVIRFNKLTKSISDCLDDIKKKLNL